MSEQSASDVNTVLPGETLADAVDRIDAQNTSMTGVVVPSGSQTKLILPDTRLKTPKKIVFANGMNWVPIFCANCGADGGLVPEENCNFAFYLCNPCAEKYGNVEGTYMEPDMLFWEKVHAEMMEKYGRELTAAELTEILKDENHPLTKLCKDRKDFEKKGRG